jgi:peptide/nickel transport system permease protein
VIIGAFVLENFFAWDGMGQALFEATRSNDLAVLMGVLSLVGIGILLAHFFFDLLTAWLDPRLRGRSGEQTVLEFVE